jgi:hypothetical protein
MSEESEREVYHLRCFSCGVEQPQDDLNIVAGRGYRSPRHFCDECVEPAKKGCGEW